MSSPDSALSDIADDVLASEVKARIEVGDIEPLDLGIKFDAADMSTSDLLAEVNQRIRAGMIDIDDLVFPADLQVGPLDEAAARFARRDYPETLWNLEKALGPAFAGLGDFSLEKRS